MKTLLQGLSSFFIIFFSTITLASTPLGFWQTYDLKKTPRDIIKISAVGDELSGIIVKSSNSKAVGKKIIWGLKQKGNQWENGYVLNIDDGKIYRCKVSISEDDHTLFFSPYAGIPLFGVTIKWLRVTRR